jgi:putative transcriptional regulator
MIRIHLSRILGERKMSRADLARATNIRPNTISHIYNEWAESVKLHHLDKICKVLKCEAHELIEYVPSAPHPEPEEKKK